MPQRYDHFFKENSISLYIHWPFCLSKCPYCSFNSHPINDLINFENWERSYFFALQCIAEKTKERSIRSIYFGGGTPSLLPATFLESLLSEISRLWSIDPHVEITLEMNPGNITNDHIRNFKNAGINRISIGVQSLTDEGLAILGRKHTVQGSLKTIELCAKLFDNYSIDLMYAWPSHSLELWKRELEEALALKAPHMSLYQLVVENESVYGTMYLRGELLLPDDNVCTDMFELTQELTEKNGIPAYEISNHAQPGFESIHNIGYWLYHDYIGIGPGAHSRIKLNQKKYAAVQESNPQKWLRSILENQYVFEESAELSLEEQSKEAILVGLRMVQGIKCHSLPLPLDQIVDWQALQRLINEDYLIYKEDILSATYKGRECLNALTLYLIK